MKIITWNCNMAFRKKAGLLAKQKPDIVVVPECEHPDKLKFDTRSLLPQDSCWFGKNHHKGLGIFSYSKYRFEILDIHNPDLQTILPLKVTGGDKDLTLFAVWANNPSDKKNQYVGQVWKAIHYYTELLQAGSTILIGDFNSNTIWDKPRREGNHSTVVDFLEKKNIHSVYHRHFNQQQGKEKHNTLFLYRHKDKPYHIDFCFASADLADRVADVRIGRHRDWCQHSDHTPLIVSFDI